ncbi:DNA-3-methyladenine glycosylase family protein [Vibrio comitans]
MTRPNLSNSTPLPTIELEYKGPLDWPFMLAFYQRRAIEHIEIIDENHYSRHALLNNQPIWFRLTQNHPQSLTLEYDISTDTQLQPLVNKLRRMFDLDADIDVIEAHLNALEPNLIKRTGIRIPGVWSSWEAGVRAVLGQQVSVTAAITHLNRLTKQLTDFAHFPSPEIVASADLSFLKMPQRRKDSLSSLAQFVVAHPNASPNEWLSIKGIGPWTVQYVQLRGLSERDCFLSGDLVVKKALANFARLNENSAHPYGSYATFHLWNQ